MTIIYVSDFDLRGSGYMNIAINLCAGLVRKCGHDVIALGLGYKGEEHDHPYPIVPTIPSLVPHMIRSLRMQQVNVEAVIVALDIPLQAAIMQELGVPFDVPYIGVFPVEGPPVCMSWAMELSRMNERLVMSRFGKNALAEVGIESTHIPIGINQAEWRPAMNDEREQIRAGLGIPEDVFVVLTVADNQERKHLSATAEIFAHFSLDVKKADKYGRILEAESARRSQWHLVTRPESPIGYKLSDLAMDFNVMDRLMLYGRGMPFKALWSLFVASDAFLLTSKAEGLAMPVLEAMACRLPVVATDCCAIHEHLTGGRGFLVRTAYEMTDPWGNSRRFLIDIQAGARALRRLANMNAEKRAAMLDKAQAYTDKRSWDKTVDVLAKAIERTTKK